MNRVIASFLSIAFSVSICAQEENKIVILHTNDLHSRLNGFSPESDYSPGETGNDQTRGGFSRIAAIMKTEKERNKGITLILDGGDFLMGTLFHQLEEKTGFQLRLMKKMGYDVVCLGNHEFDFGPQKLANTIIHSANEGEIPQLLLGNAVFNEKDNRDDTLEQLFISETIRRKVILEKNGHKIGIFSILGKDAVDVAPLAEPVKFSGQIKCARAMVKELQKSNCDLIICLSHSGVSMDKDGEWTGEDVRLAESVKGIDVIISGHTHTSLINPMVINGIPIVQTGAYGQNVGRLALSWTNGKLTINDYKLIPVDDNITGDKEIQDLIEKQEQIVSEEILAPLGMKYSDPVAETDFSLECNEHGDFKESNLGPLVADAIYDYLNSHTEDGCDISMVAVGVIRDNIVPGIETAPDIFRIMSLGSGKDGVPGYPLSRLYLYGKELKNVLEILQVAYKSSASNYCFFSGLDVEYNPEKGLLRKISKIRIIDKEGDLSEVSFSKHDKTLYSITANFYMLEFIGIIKKMSFGLINVIPKDSEGNVVTDMQNSIIDMDEDIPGIQEGKEWLAMKEFLEKMEDYDHDGIPDIDRKYSVPVQTFHVAGK